MSHSDTTAFDTGVNDDWHVVLTLQDDIYIMETSTRPCIARADCTAIVHPSSTHPHIFFKEAQSKQGAYAPSKKDSPPAPVPVQERKVCHSNTLHEIPNDSVSSGDIPDVKGSET